MSILAIDLNISPARCVTVPPPAEAKLIVPGLAVASAINSRELAAASAGLATRMPATLHRWITGSKSFSVSNGNFG